MKIFISCELRSWGLKSGDLEIRSESDPRWNHKGVVCRSTGGYSWSPDICNVLQMLKDKIGADVLPIDLKIICPERFRGQTDLPEV